MATVNRLAYYTAFTSVMQAFDVRLRLEPQQKSSLPIFFFDPRKP